MNMIINKAFEEGKKARLLLGSARWGYSHVLLNIIRSENYHDFIYAIAKFYVQNELDVPSLFVEDINKENFKDVGSAFVLGILGE
jgi:hypothetical protein